jgi:hypothetical protein
MSDLVETIAAQAKEIERLKSDKETLATKWEDAPSGTPMGRIKHHRGAASFDAVKAVEDLEEWERQVEAAKAEKE